MSHSLLQSLMSQRQDIRRVSAVGLKAGSREVVVREDEFVIGRAAVCDLTVEHEQVGDFHAVIRLQANTAWIEEMDPQRPLLVNGQEYRRLALRDGDRLSFGEQEWTVSLLTAEELQQAPAPRELSAEELCDRLSDHTADELDHAAQQHIRLSALVAAARRMASDTPAPVAAIPQAADVLSQFTAWLQAAAGAGEVTTAQMAEMASSLGVGLALGVSPSHDEPRLIGFPPRETTEPRALPGPAQIELEQRLMQILRGDEPFRDDQNPSLRATA